MGENLLLFERNATRIRGTKSHLLMDHGNEALRPRCQRSRFIVFTRRRDETSSNNSFYLFFFQTRFDAACTMLCAISIRLEDKEREERAEEIHLPLFKVRCFTD